MTAGNQPNFEVLMLKSGRWQLIEVCKTLKDAMEVMEGERATAAGLRVTRETFKGGRGYETVVLHEWVAPVAPKYRPPAGASSRKDIGHFAAAKKPGQPAKQPGFLDKLRRMIGF